MFFFFLFQINIDYQMREATAKKAQDPTHTSFDEVQKTVYVLMERDSYPRFLKSKSYLNLLNQLQTNTSKWSVWSVKSQADCQLSCEEILHGGWILPRKIPVLEGAVRGRWKQLHDQWVQDKSRWAATRRAAQGENPLLPHAMESRQGMENHVWPALWTLNRVWSQRAADCQEVQDSRAERWEKMTKCRRKTRMTDNFGHNKKMPRQDWHLL